MVGWPSVTLQAARDPRFCHYPVSWAKRKPHGVAIHPRPQGKKEKGGGISRKFEGRVPHKCPQIGCGWPYTSSACKLCSLQDLGLTVWAV